RHARQRGYGTGRGGFLGLLSRFVRNRPPTTHGGLLRWSAVRADWPDSSSRVRDPTLDSGSILFAEHFGLRDGGKTAWFSPENGPYSLPPPAPLRSIRRYCSH